MIENVKSFFSKEEELMQEPKGIPEAASDIFEHPKHRTEQPKRIVDRPLPPQEKKLPYTPEDLRKALGKPEERKEVDDGIHSEINAFEDALKEVDQPEEKMSQSSTIPQTPTITSESPFFNEFEQFLMHEDLEAEGLLEEDILHKLREFHKHQSEGKQYYVYRKDVKDAMGRKLQELKGLEQEWFYSQEKLDDLKRGLSQIEKEIESRSQELKGLLKQERSKSRLENKAPPGEEFILTDGRKLSSLLDLKIALRTMPEQVFRHHVTSTTNHFVPWIQNALKEEEVAAALGKMHSKHEMEQYLSNLAH